MHQQYFTHHFLVKMNNHHSYVPLLHTGHVSADPDSAEDIAEDPDAAVDEEEDDEEEVLVEEDQIQPTVCMI